MAWFRKESSTQNEDSMQLNKTPSRHVDLQPSQGNLKYPHLQISHKIYFKLY